MVVVREEVMVGVGRVLLPRLAMFHLPLASSPVADLEAAEKALTQPAPAPANGSPESRTAPKKVHTL